LVILVWFFFGGGRRGLLGGPPAKLYHCSLPDSELLWMLTQAWL
jgi:hypothetical protein